MHLEILSEEQKKLLPYIAQFKRSFYLVGGTAIALHIGHRQSIDFDLFTLSKINKSKLKERLWKIPFKKEMIFEDVDQLHLSINGVKATFFQYPYLMEHTQKLDNIITLPNLLSLSAMKAFALGRRAKWKDYVDLYFIIKDYFPIKEIAGVAEKLFDTQFSEKLFLQQLTYHKDINYTEKVEYMPGYEVDEEVVKAFLINKALEPMI